MRADVSDDLISGYVRDGEERALRVRGGGESADAKGLLYSQTT